MTKKSTYTKNELLKEMRSALLPFSQMYEKIQNENGWSLSDEINRKMSIGVEVDDLRKAHFFCRHKSVHVHLEEDFKADQR